MTRRHRLTAGSIAISILGIWALVAFLIGPSEIARGYRGESLSFINDLFGGRDETPLAHYLADWHRLTGALGRLLVLAVLVGYGTLELLASAAGRRFRGFVRERVEQATALGPSWPLSQALLLAIWLGLVTGLVDAVYTVIQQRHLPTVKATTYSIGWDGIWMAPVFNALLLIVLAVVLHAPRLGWRRLVLDRVLIVSLAGLALFGLFRRTIPSIHPYAAVLLAAGLAVQLARMFTSRPDRWRSVVRRSTVWLGLGLAAWTVALHVVAGVRARKQLAALSEPAEGSPNVLLIILDTVRAQSLGLYGYERPTSPVLDSVAAGGVTFSNALTTAPWTLPSHASMFTGRWAHELSADWETRLDDRYPTLAEWFGEHGYVTAGFVANFYYGGFDYGLSRGFIHYDANPNVYRALVSSSWLGREVARFVRRHVFDSRQLLSRVHASEVREKFLGWLGGAEERPYFAFLNLFDAHAPYLPPEPFHETFARPGARYWMGPGGATYSDTDKQDITDSYDSSIAYVDHELGILLRELSRAGALDNTIVVIASDHGEEFFEHGVSQHGNSLYLPTLWVPFVVLWPEHLPEGLVVEESVSLRDLPATLTRLIDGEEDPAFPGRSLTRWWTDSDGSPTTDDVLYARLSARDHLPEEYPAAKGDMESIVVDGMHYIRGAEGIEELYDILADPWERSDLSETEAGRQRLPQLRALLDAASPRDRPE